MCNKRPKRTTLQQKERECAHTFSLLVSSSSFDFSSFSFFFKSCSRQKKLHSQKIRETWKRTSKLVWRVDETDRNLRYIKSSEMLSIHVCLGTYVTYFWTTKRDIHRGVIWKCRFMRKRRQSGIRRLQRLSKSKKIAFTNMTSKKLFWSLQESTYWVILHQPVPLKVAVDSGIIKNVKFPFLSTWWTRQLAGTPSEGCKW